ERFDDGKDPPALFLLGHRIGPGPRGLTTDVDDVGALRDQLVSARDRVGMVEIAAAIGERVGRDVDHAHDLHHRSGFCRYTRHRSVSYVPTEQRRGVTWIAGIASPLRGSRRSAGTVLAP